MADKFDKAVKIVQELPADGPVTPSQADKLDFYAWYKIATVGAVNTPRPGMFDLVGKAKWDAWKKAHDETPAAEDCKKLYVEKLIGILKGSDSEEAKALLAQLEA